MIQQNTGRLTLGEINKKINHCIYHSAETINSASILRGASVELIRDRLERAIHFIDVGEFFLIENLRAIYLEGCSWRLLKNAIEIGNYTVATEFLLLRNDLALTNNFLRLVLEYSTASIMRLSDILLVKKVLLEHNLDSHASFDVENFFALGEVLGYTWLTNQNMDYICADQQMSSRKIIKRLKIDTEIISPDSFLDEVADFQRLRYKIYVEKNGFEQENKEKKEIDEYDSESKYILVKKENVVIAGCRLVPNNTSVLMPVAKKWPSLCFPVNCFEISRFCIDNDFPGKVERIDIIRCLCLLAQLEVRKSNAVGLFGFIRENFISLLRRSIKDVHAQSVLLDTIGAVHVSGTLFPVRFMTQEDVFAWFREICEFYINWPGCLESGVDYEKMRCEKINDLRNFDDKDHLKDAVDDVTKKHFMHVRSYQFL